MFKNKFALAATTGMLAVCVGLSACGGTSSASSSSATQEAATPVTEAVAEVASTPATASEAETNEILYWEGTLADGSIVDFLDNAFEGVAVISISKPDYSDVKVWYGTSNSDSNGKVTVTDAESTASISYTISDISPKLESLTINLDNYGEVVLKPVTKADIQAAAEELAASAKAEGEKLLEAIGAAGAEFFNGIKSGFEQVKAEFENLSKEYEQLDDSTVFFWEGKLEDGSTVSYMSNVEAKEATLLIVAEDLSDAVMWNGTTGVAQDGSTMVITDAESGEVVTYKIVQTVPNTSMTLDIDGIGKVTLSPVTKGNFASYLKQ